MKKFLVSCFVVLVLTSCGNSKPTKFYHLTARPTASQKIINKKIIVGIDTVNVAGYIDRPQIVTLKDNAELNMSEFNRWPESLSFSVQRIIADNISSHMKNGMAKPLSLGRRNYDYIVFIELGRLDGKFDDKVYLEAWWSIVNKDNKLVAREFTSLSAPVGTNYTDLVQNQSELISQLSEIISRKLNRL